MRFQTCNNSKICPKWWPKNASCNAGELYFFTNNNKKGHLIRPSHYAKVLQDYLHRLCEWMEKWQMQFTTSKCGILNAGEKKKHFNKCTLNNTIGIGRLNCERDLGVLLRSDLWSRKQCITARNQAYGISSLSTISMSMHSRSAEVILKLYLALVRSHLDYAAQFLHIP